MAQPIIALSFQQSLLTVSKLNNSADIPSWSLIPDRYLRIAKFDLFSFCTCIMRYLC